MESLVVIKKGKGSKSKSGDVNKEGQHQGDASSRRESCSSASGNSNSNKDMQDFSMSSIISNLSRLVDGNNSSFLMHVDSNPNSRRNSTSSSVSPRDFQETQNQNAQINVVAVPAAPPTAAPTNDNNMKQSSCDKDKKKDKEPEKKQKKLSPEEKPPKDKKDEEGSQRDKNSSNDTATASESSDFFLEDWMKNYAGAPLHIRRFPPPPLPAIFEQSGEESVCHSSRPSSVVSAVSSMKSVQTKSKKPLPAEGSSIQEKMQSTISFLEGVKTANESEADAEHGRQRVDFDSWDEFDREMDKSLLPKECELQEFEKLASKNPNGSVLPNDDNTLFGSAEDIIERDEKERDQFCKSADNTFSAHDSFASDVGDRAFLSITNYFKSRSSFPVANIANESSRFLDDSVVVASPPEEQIRLDFNNDNLKLTRNYSSLFPEDDQDTLTPRTPILENSSSPLPVTASDDAASTETPVVVKSYSLDKKTKQLASFLVGSESNGAGKSTIMDYVMDVCRRKSSIGTSETSESLRKHKNQRDASSDSNKPAPSVLFKEMDAYHANNKSGKVHHYPLPNPPLPKVTFKEDPKLDSVALKKHLAPKLPESQLQSNSEGGLLGRLKASTATATRVQPVVAKPTQPNSSMPMGLKRKPEPVIQDNEPLDEKSFLISEPGKVLHDDIDGFDKFKSNLNKPKPSRGKLTNLHIYKENRPPKSAFTIPSLTKENIPASTLLKVGNQDSKAASVERLRTGVCLSPPERPYDSTRSKRSTSERDVAVDPNVKTPDKDHSLRLDANHSTPIAPESGSKLLIQRLNTQVDQHGKKNELGQDSLASLISTISTASSTKTVRRNEKVQPQIYENATSTRNSSPVHAEKKEKTLPTSDPISNSRNNDDSKKAPTPTNQKEDEDGASKTENVNLAASCRHPSRNLPEGHHGQHPSSFASVPSTYSYMGGMMPPPGGCNHAPQPFPISIHIHLPSFPMGFPAYQYGTHSNTENFHVGANAASGIPPDSNPSCSNNCKCSHQGNSQTHR